MAIQRTKPSTVATPKNGRTKPTCRRDLRRCGRVGQIRRTEPTTRLPDHERQLKVGRHKPTTRARIVRNQRRKPTTTLPR